MRATTTGCRWTSTSAASSTRCCTCLRALLDQGDARLGPRQVRWSRSPSCSRKALLLNESFYRETEREEALVLSAKSTSAYADKGTRSARPLTRTASTCCWAASRDVEVEEQRRRAEDIIAKFGADTARLFTMFAGPPRPERAWSDPGAEGSFRYLHRLGRSREKTPSASAPAATRFDANDQRRRKGSAPRSAPAAAPDQPRLTTGCNTPNRGRAR